MSAALLRRDQPGILKVSRDWLESRAVEKLGRREEYAVVELFSGSNIVVLHLARYGISVNVERHLHVNQVDRTGFSHAKCRTRGMGDTNSFELTVGSLYQV